MHWIPVSKSTKSKTILNITICLCAKVALSLFGSNVGSEHFIGLSGSGASSGIGISGFEFTAMYLILVLGWYFMPVYMASNVSTKEANQTQQKFGFLFYADQYNAGIFTKALWWPKNQDLFVCFGLNSLYLYKNIGKFQMKQNGLIDTEFNQTGKPLFRGNFH